MKNWKSYIAPAVLTFVTAAMIGLISVIYGHLMAADEKNEKRIEAVSKDTEKELDKKVDNMTLQLQIELMREQTKTIQMQINQQNEKIKEIKKP